MYEKVKRKASSRLSWVTVVWDVPSCKAQWKRVREIRVRVGNLVGLEWVDLKVNLDIFTVISHLNYSIRIARSLYPSTFPWAPQWESGTPGFVPKPLLLLLGSMFLRRMGACSWVRTPEGAGFRKENMNCGGVFSHGEMAMEEVRFCL